MAGSTSRCASAAAPAGPRGRGPGPRASIAALLFAMAAATIAAEEPDLHTDRDAFTPATRCIAAGTSLLEGSQVFIDNRTGTPTNSYPELLVRYAATEWWEWRVGINYSVGSQGNVVTSVEVGELPIDGHAVYESNILFGFKAALTEQDAWVPESCFIMEATTPTYAEEWGTSPVATVVWGWELPAGSRLDAALRYAYSVAESGWFSRWGPSVVWRRPVTERWEVHAEFFSSSTQGLPDDTVRPFFSPGTHLLITPRLEIGLRVGWGLTNDAAPFFSDAGIGWKY
jgi:hypothetical protein